MNNLVVTWTDKDGKKQSKQYTDQRLAYKARQWLLENGATEIDVAVVFKPKPKPDLV